MAYRVKVCYAGDMNRTAMFFSYKTHPMLGRSFKKLSHADIEAVLEFIKMHDHLDKGSFERAAVRLFLDCKKPKTWKEIEELLVCANSAIK